MRKIRVALRHQVDDSYDIELSRGCFGRMAGDLKSSRFAEKWVVFSDSRVNKYYGSQLCRDLKRADLYLGKVVVTSGEQSKCLSQQESVIEEMIAMGANRKTGVIALGGGVVGDLAGFCAATFMRGIPFVQVPTTLLAMVDSSVGGKVGVDAPSGKNMIGAFWQPKKVYIDVDLLRSLPMKQWKAGLGEALKYGAIRDRKLWDFFEASVQVFSKVPKHFLPGDLSSVEEMIFRCVEIKADVVKKDERESGLRQILNFGHTFAHVVELMSGYAVPHGEAVAVGMRMAGMLARRLRFMSDAEYHKLSGLLDAYGIGVSKTKGLIDDFVKHMKKDKKARGDLRVVLVDRIGCCKQMLGNYAISVPESEVKAMLKESGLIDDVEPGAVSSHIPPSPSSPSWGSGGYYDGAPSTFSPPGVRETPSSYFNSQEYRASGGFGAGSLVQQQASDIEIQETEFQRRLREMRERREARERARQMLQEGHSGGGLGRGGFLPG